MQINCILLHVVLMNSNQYCSTWRVLTCDLWVTIPSWSPHKVHRTNKLQHIANRKLLLSIWEFSLSLALMLHMRKWFAFKCNYSFGLRLSFSLTHSQIQLAFTASEESCKKCCICWDSYMQLMHLFIHI